jgi:hypothetical protein
MQKSLQPLRYGERVLLTFAVVVLIGSANPAFAQSSPRDYPQWRGQNRDGAASAFMLNDDAELIVARSSRTGFEPLKRYTVADSATWAQPVISANRVFVKDVSSLALWTLN